MLSIGRFGSGWYPSFDTALPRTSLAPVESTSATKNELTGPVSSRTSPGRGPRLAEPLLPHRDLLQAIVELTEQVRLGRGRDRDRGEHEHDADDRHGDDQAGAQ